MQPSSPAKHSASHFSRSGSHATTRGVCGIALLALISASAQASQEVPQHDTTDTTLPAVQVIGEDDSTTTEGTNAYTPRATAASTGLALSLRETPQSVTVITRQRIEDQNMRSLVDVMTHTPGISVQHYDSERATFNARGFSISNYLYDGMPTSFDINYSSGESSLDSIIYDRVEVVRGATGLLTGTGNPSASINLVRKHAISREFKADVSVSAGNWDNYRASADLSTPFNTSARVRARLVSAYQDNHSHLEGYRNRKKIFYGVVDADLTARTTLSVGWNYQDNAPRRSTYGGFPLWYVDGGRTDWKRSLNTGANWNAWASTTQGAFVSLEQRFDNDWRVQATGSYSKHAMDGKLLLLRGYPDRLTGLGMKASPAWYLGDRKQNGLDIKATGPLALFGRRHEVVMGVSASREKTDFHYRKPLLPMPVNNFLQWDGSYPEPDWAATTATAGRDTTRQTAGYGALRLSLADPIKLIVGGRYSIWKIDSIGWAGGNRHAFDKHAFTPYAGLLYDINETYTAYFSYSRIFNPQEYQDRHGNWIDPLNGKAYEAGLKGEFMQGRLNASAAVFQIDQNHLKQRDTGYLVPGTINPAWRATQDARSRGYELELSGQATPGWNLAAGWSQWTARDSDGKPIQTHQPRALLHLFTTYQLPGQLNRLTVGGGVNWQSHRYSLVRGFSDIPAGPKGTVRVDQGSYAIASLMARYRFDRRLTAQLNINNLLDRKYYSQIGFFSQGAWASGRSALLTLRYQH